jgi:Domain of unknown function (DUF4956)
VPPTNVIPDLDALGVALAIDLVAVAVLALGISFRRRGRRDLVMAAVCANVALFAVVTVLGLVGSDAGLAIGLGLFGALSIIRLRSEPLSHAEIAYFFSALALAIVNGFATREPALGLLLSGVVVGAVYAMTYLAPSRSLQRLMLVLDEVYPDEAALRAAVERRLDARVVALTILEIDYVRDITRLEVECAPRAALDVASDRTLAAPSPAVGGVARGR